MPAYSYLAKTLKGETKTGILEAKNEHQLSQILHQQGYILISAEPVQKTRKSKIKWDFLFLGRVSLKEKMLFTRNLQVMISAGVALPRAIKTLAFQTENRKFRQTLLDIKKQLIKGKDFSDCLKEHKDVFSDLFINMVKVGEESGTLEESLKNLAFQMEKEHQLRTRIKGAMMYPLVIISAMLGIGMLMLTMVVPKLAKTFEEFNMELPFTTKLVIALGTFLVEKWYLLLLIIISFFLLWSLIPKTKKGARIIDGLLLKLPIISPIIKKTNSSHLTRTLSCLIKSGVPIVRSLEIASHSLGNFYFREAISKAAQKVKKGNKLSDVLSPYQNLPQ